MYRTFKECAENLANIKAVDFFFAKEVFDLIKRCNYRDTRLRGYDGSIVIPNSDRESPRYSDNSQNNDMLHFDKLSDRVQDDSSHAQSDNYNVHDDSDVVLFHLLMKLMSAYSHGHSCIMIKDIADEKKFACQEDGEELKVGYKFPNYAKLIDILNSINYTNLPIYFAKDFDSLYIKRLWLYDNEIAEFIKQKTKPNVYGSDNVEHVVSQLFQPSEGIDWQKNAVVNSFKYDFSIISGGPGTGKTTTVAKLLLAIQMLNENDPKIALLAPTGKAAQRMTESLKASLTSNLSFVVIPDTERESHNFNDKDTRLREYDNSDVQSSLEQCFNHLQNIEAQTIHRFLGLRPNSNYIKYHKASKAPYDVVVVDEASMLDINIFIKLIRSIDENTKLILLGDINQLPSVEAGSLLANFTASPDGSITNYTTKLVKNYRSQQYINSLANDILAGSVNIEEGQSEYIRFYDLNKLDRCLKNYVDKYRLIQQCNNHIQALKQLGNFRILVANKNLEIGTVRLNQRIEGLLGKAIDSNYKGRPIMITQNSYSLGLFNGDVGIIWPDSTGKLRAYFDDKQDKTFSLNMLPKYESVYVMTIHKTQGSEFNEVAMILPVEDNEALTKQLIYTGITRAKSKLDIVATTNIFNMVIKKDLQRSSNIHRLLRDWI